MVVEGKMHGFLRMYWDITSEEATVIVKKGKFLVFYGK
jgi:hypothetical protein